MMVVIEGMDNSGKSTLALALSDYMRLPIMESEGPPKSDEEINERVDKYERFGDAFLYDRHPVVSNEIYGAVRLEGNPITPGRSMIFYESKPIFIYCDAGERGLDAHVRKAHDTDKHIDDITRNYTALLEAYRTWAAKHAHFMYRIGDDMDGIKGAVHYYRSFLLAVQEQG
jgi:chloramphenicol 3-O-phosphotransferase